VVNELRTRQGDPFSEDILRNDIRMLDTTHDPVGRVRSVAQEGDGRRVWVDAPESVLGYTIEKGSIAVDGVSLTVAAFDDDGFEVALIPHTLAVTTLGRLEPADEVNLEADVLGKVVERLVAGRLP